MPSYSRIVSPDELLERQVEAVRGYAHVNSVEDAYDMLDEYPLVEIGREDYSSKPGARAVIDPCPFCDGYHSHGFGVELEQGYPVREESKCSEGVGSEKYWLVWLGKGEGVWQERESFLSEPTFSP